jgi:hypothetical protein
MGIVAGVTGLCRERRHRHLTPHAGAVATPQLGAEMAEVEGGIDGAVGVCQHRGNRIAEELCVGYLPLPVAARDLEQTLAGSDMEPIDHPLLHQPPDSAWKT